MPMRALFSLLIGGLACLSLGAPPARADLATFNSAVQHNNFPVAARAAGAVWSELDKGRGDIGLIAREFAWISMLGQRPEQTRDITQFLLSDGAENDPSPHTTRILSAWAAATLNDTQASRRALLDALQLGLETPGADLVAIAAAMELVDRGETEAQAIIDAQQVRRGAVSLPEQRDQDLNTIILTTYGTPQEPQILSQLSRLDDIIYREAAHPANAAWREELLAIHDKVWAWRIAIHSALRGTKRQFTPATPPHPESIEYRLTGEAPDGRNKWFGEVRGKYQIRYPRTEMTQWKVGAVILDIPFDAEGRPGQASVLAAAPEDGPFVQALLDAAPRFRLVRDSDRDERTCDLARNHHAYVIQFTIEG